MKRSKTLEEIHKIREQIYEEDKGLTPEQRIKKAREESEKFMKEAKLNLRRVKPKKLKPVLKQFSGAYFERFNPPTNCIRT